MYKTVSWKTGPNRGPSKQVDHKKIKKYADAWARANGYKPQASSNKGRAGGPSSAKRQARKFLTPTKSLI